MSTYREHGTGRSGLGTWGRGRWIAVGTILIAIAAVVVLIVLYAGGGGSGGSGGGY
jgi:hypothetical protein